MLARLRRLNVDSQTEELVKKLHRNPRDAEVLAQLRANLLAEKRFRALAALLEWWAKKAPTSQAAAQALYDAGAALEPLEEMSRAIDLYLSCIARDPSHLAASLRVEALLTATKEHERVIDALERQAAALGAGVYPRSARAQVLARLGRARHALLSDLDGAIEAFRQAVNSEPKEIPLAEELIALYLERSRKSERAAADADRDRAAELFHRIAKAVGGVQAIPYLESALDLAPGYLEALEILERLAPQLKPAPDLKRRWSAFIDQAGSGTVVDLRRHQLAKALVGEEHLEAAIEVLHPLAEQGDDKAQRLVEQLQRRLGLEPTGFLSPEERSEIALLEVLRSADEEEFFDESDTTTGVRGDSPPAFQSSRPPPPATAPGPYVPPKPDTFAPPKPIRAAMPTLLGIPAPKTLAPSSSVRPAPSAFGPGAHGDVWESGKAKPAHHVNPDDELPTARAEVPASLLEALEKRRLPTADYGAIARAAFAAAAPAIEADAIPGEPTHADANRPLLTSDSWSDVGPSHDMPSGEHTEDVESDELSSFDEASNEPPPSIDSLSDSSSAPDELPDEETTVTGRVEAPYRSSLAPETPAPQVANGHDQSASAEAPIAPDAAAPQSAEATASPAKKEVPKEQRLVPAIVVTRSTSERVLSREAIVQGTYARPEAPFRVKLGEAGKPTTLEVVSPVRCAITRDTGTSEEVEGPGSMSLVKGDVVRIEHEAVTYTVSLELVPARRPVLLIVGLVLATIALVLFVVLMVLLAQSRRPDPPAPSAPTPPTIDAALVVPSAPAVPVIAAAPDAAATTPSVDAAVADAAVDAPSDAPVDAGLDASLDAAVDASIDASLDAVPLAAPDASAATPFVRLRSPLVRLEGSLRRGVVTHALDTANEAMVACWTAARGRGVLAGDLQLMFGIASSGRARTARRTGGTIEDATLVECMSAAISRPRFGRPRGGVVEAAFDFGSE